MRTMFVLLAFLWATPAFSAQVIHAVKVKQAPVVDGLAGEAIWQKAPALTIRDKVADVDVVLRAIYTEDRIYFLVRYADPTEDRLQKPWIWDKGLEAYVMGPQREDTFAFRWNLEKRDVNLSNFSDDSFHSDIWYWKANRTDPAGFADDKLDILTDESGRKAQEVVSDKGRKRYLMRLSDQGSPAQQKRIFTSYQGDLLDQFEPAMPTGSLADIAAKGVWKDGFWTIEFGRKLKTGYNDEDVQFNPAAGRPYLFGVSIYGLYGEHVDRSASHLYGMGRISDPIRLVFK